jgi:hypothetical protein
MTNTKQIPTAHHSRKEDAVLYVHETQLLTVRQRTDERIAEADAERLSHDATAHAPRATFDGPTVKQRLGRRLIALGESIAQEARPATDAGA